MDYRSPLAVTREIFAEVWTDVLPIDGAEDDQNFFQLGGDSIGAMRLTSELSSRSGLTIDPAAVFEHPVFIDLLEFLQSEP
jgi:acyl carrier protein